MSVASGFSLDLIRIAWLTHTNLYYRPNIFLLTLKILSRFLHLSPPSVLHWFQIVMSWFSLLYVIIYATSPTGRSRTRAWQWQFDQTWLDPNVAIIGPWSLQCCARSQDPAHDKHLSVSVHILTSDDKFFKSTASCWALSLNSMDYLVRRKGFVRNIFFTRSIFSGSDCCLF